MNHDGSFGQAKAIIDSACGCGVDAVKFQTHIFEAESLPDAPAPEYFKSESRKEFFKRTSFTKDEWMVLKKHAQSRGVVFISSPFSLEAVDLLEDIALEVYKIPSGEVSNTPLLEKVAKTGKRILLSSGMSSWEELDRAVNAVRKFNDNLTVLQCTSSYPCGYDEVGLNLISEMRQRYGLPVGLSDHTQTIYASLTAVALGAVVIERHYTLSKEMYGPDAKFSIEPNEMRTLVEGIRAAEIMLNTSVDKDEKVRGLGSMKMIFEKSIVAAFDMSEGTVLSLENMAFKKPGDGIPAAQYESVSGRKLNKAVKKDHKFAQEDFY
ncbi:N-acetylneuraminate synthase family protein [Candidatus Magnetomonas plexicatena]|uniref:N-acetylneuraminate synthase family protein n=1 Tax=Candidatus Magnetomonas plexicatena TaxID=2552947 RepID=UPI001C771202|nr:N-acetylneuraminate synthase [Nitrospirales bacterium LBB_01]